MLATQARSRGVGVAKPIGLTELLCRHLKVLQGVTTREVWSCEELPEEPPVRSGLAVVSPGPTSSLLGGHAAF